MIKCPFLDAFETKDNNAKGKATEATNRPAGQLKAECDFWLLSKDPWSPPGFFDESCMLIYDQYICISASMNLYHYPTYMCNPTFNIDTIHFAARITQGHTLLQLGSKKYHEPLGPLNKPWANLDTCSCCQGMILTLWRHDREGIAQAASSLAVLLALVGFGVRTVRDPNG